MALKLPPTLKLSHLKSLAFQCGLLTSGTKPVLVSRLQHGITPLVKASNSFAKSSKVSLTSGGALDNGFRVLSIDMGIRNLAYCMLSLPLDFPATNESITPSIEAWQRTSLSPTSTLSGVDIAEKEVFDPTSMSLMAYKLLSETLLPLNPTHILIERQRFRSMGSPHILEWTIRVNTLESMLYAILHTLKSSGMWHGSVLPILPGKVGGFWLPGKLEAAGVTLEEVEEKKASAMGKKRNTKSAKLLNKGAKIDLVRDWLDGTKSSSRLNLGSEGARLAALRYMEEWDRAPGQRRVKVATEEDLITKGAQLCGEGPKGKEAKLDDLADCLLQGMAWIRWEENKNAVLERGVEALDLNVEPRSLKGV